MKPVLVALLFIAAPLLRAQTPVVFDTDMAIDDWAALLYLQLHPELELRAVTVSASGETHCEPGLRNALALLHLAGEARRIPVACGDPWPLDGYLVFPAAWQRDADTLSGNQIPPSPHEAETLHAVKLLHREIGASARPVALLVTGPLTNIAQWLERYPEDAARVERLVIMGGAYAAPGNIVVPGFTDGHPNARAEWNFYIDPVAADRVLQSGLPIELVGLDVTNTVRVTEAFAREFKEHARSPAARFWDAVLDSNDWFIESGEYYFWDVLAAITLTDGERFCRGEKKALRAIWSYTDSPRAEDVDMEIPAVLADGSPRRHLDSATAGVLVDGDGEGGEGGERKGEPTTLLCLATDAEAAFASYIEVVGKSR